MSSPGFNPMQNANRANADALSRATQASDRSYRIQRRRPASALANLVALLIALGVLAVAGPIVLGIVAQIVHAAH